MDASLWALALRTPEGGPSQPSLVECQRLLDA